MALFAVEVRTAPDEVWRPVSEHEDADPSTGHGKRQRAAAYECEECANQFRAEMAAQFPEAEYRVQPYTPGDDVERLLIAWMDAQYRYIYERSSNIPGDMADLTQQAHKRAAGLGLMWGIALQNAVRVMNPDV